MLSMTVCASGVFAVIFVLSAWADNVLQPPYMVDTDKLICQQLVGMNDDYLNRLIDDMRAKSVQNSSLVTFGDEIESLKRRPCDDDRGGEEGVRNVWRLEFVLLRPHSVDCFTYISLYAWRIASHTNLY
ncbi:unnamed protein product [Sphagnum balticum]